MAIPESKKELLLDKMTETAVNPIAVNNTNAYLYTKRFIDIVGALTGLVLLSLLLLLVIILIKIESAGESAFFVQERIGKDGKRFKMYKFRSMVSNAEDLKVTLINQNETTGPVFKIKRDPRVTRVGKIIRKTSMDELPQLLNILKGDMSLVGPRPPLPEEVEQYTLYERQRLCVTPGLTCYWQVSGRSNITFNEWVRLDLKYIEEQCILVDIKLIFRTVFVLFGSKDAY